MAESQEVWSPALFESADDGDAWTLKDGALERAFAEAGEQPCRVLWS